MRFYIETYGCQMNAHDSEIASGILREAGHSSAQNKNEAEFILFNTCCVREHAEKKVFGNVGALRARKDEQPGLIIGVMGCMMQQGDVAKRLLKRYPFVNFALGTNSMHMLLDILERAESSGVQVYASGGDDIIEDLPIMRAEGMSASINIMYGCDNYCSYCIVPYVRGAERSRECARIVEEIKGLVGEGFTEIMLLGQNVNSYGAGTDVGFTELLEKVSAIEGLRRIRFMTSHPKDLSDELIAAMARLPNICKHLHLPVQSGSDSVLARMNRKYTREDYLRLVGKLRDANPWLELTTDIIVGFPGETEDEFSDTLSLIDSVGFSSAFTFMYSPRSGTAAAGMDDQVPMDIKKERLKRLNALQAIKTKESNARYIDMIGEVLIEGCDERRSERMLYGKLSCLKTVYFPGTPDRIGQYATVRIKKTRDNSLIGAEEAARKDAQV